MALYESVEPRKRLSGQLSFVFVWFITTAIAAWLRPDPSGHGTHTQLGLPPCPSVLLFNRPCPGCGLTTSFSAFVHGNFAFAFHAHPLGPILYMGMTLWAGLCLYGWVKGLRLDGGGPAFNKAVTAFAIVFFAFGIGRMILDPGFSGGPEQRYVSKYIANAQPPAKPK
jgi:hypothetical protein